ncbi:hypothetical protein Cpap_2345 [Ruminiclostridium papyrosolvens DSM 2782]|uniref:Uncharacterized protein n=1 Tax=Ruminiclostridium papyrosolvens DSM 2782 TaxID=588581 RepID=F1TAZ1_9FIRM|nr:hypothetical protein Cpap_2345 [Ruminiclostridium papyrosolvens DSM 2782]
MLKTHSECMSKINMTKQVIKPCKSEHNKEIEG